MVTPETRLRSSSGTCSYMTVVRIGLSMPAPRPARAIVTASGSVVSVNAATTYRVAPEARKAAANTARRGNRSPHIP